MTRWEGFCEWASEAAACVALGALVAAMIGGLWALHLIKAV